MALQNGDLKISIVPDDIGYSYLENTVGFVSSFKIVISNFSTTDPIYNTSLTLIFPDGITFVSGSIIPNSNIINSNYENVLEFISISDLFNGEKDLSFTINYKLEEYYRGTALPLVYNSFINNIIATAYGDSTPQGTVNPLNIQISDTSSINLRICRFQIQFTSPISHIKGAGFNPGTTIDATKIFPIEMLLKNSTRDSSIVNLNLELGNGFRYCNSWTTSGTNAANFLNPIISPPASPSKNNYNLLLNSKNLSKGSQTLVTLQIAIWNNYCINGIENTGNYINHGDILDAYCTLTGNSSTYTEEVEIEALDIDIAESSDAYITDVNDINSHTISYSTNQYTSFNDVIITKIIPNGMELLTGTVNPAPSSISTSLGITTLTWNMTSLSANFTGIISLNTKVKSTYYDNNPVFSADILVNTSIIEGTRNSDSISIENSSVITFNIELPLISIEVLGYYNSSFSLKPINVATIGDYIRFKLTYNASGLNAMQHDVEVLDYGPPGLSLAGSINIVTQGDIPPGFNYEVIAHNGIRGYLGDMNPNSFFTITYDVPVISGFQDDAYYNLVKLHLFNSSNTSFSNRDQVLVYFGVPHLQIVSNSTSSGCVVLNDTLTYTVTLVNYALDPEELVYISDAYNMVATATIPSLYTIIGTPTISGNATFNNYSLNNNILTVTIPHMAPETNLTLNAVLKVDTLPILGENYNIEFSTTNGTSQVSESSYHYTDNKFPLSNNLLLKTCEASISKYFVASTVALGDYYTSYISVTIPKGIIAYNTKIKDSLVSTDSSYFANLLLNGSPVPYSLSTNNIQVPLLPIMDTTNSQLHYELQYEDRIMVASPINYEDTRVVLGQFAWSKIATFPDDQYKEAPATLKIVVPSITTTKYQQNETRGTAFETAPIVCRDNDKINYKLSLSNIGKSAAISTVIKDTIPNTLSYDGIVGAIGSFNNITKLLTVTIPSIAPNTIANVIINTTVINDSEEVIATNKSYSTFKANSNLPSDYGNSTSNSVILYKNIVALIKYQRNSTLGEDFTDREIRCFANQEVQYKLVIDNPLDEPITSIVLNDTFPSEFNFISYEPFTGGTLNVSSNNVTINLSNVPANSRKEIIYTIKLNVDSFARVSSRGTLNYTINNAPNINTTYSNTLYILISTNGKGFSIY